MNEIIEKESIKIENIIYEIRGKQVMLDSDLAKLYQVETKRINEAVSRNIEKFPERFSWILTEDEVSNLWSQFATTKINSKRRNNPRAFTEQGVAMLATILKSKIATKVSIEIMDAFVSMRKYISSNLLEQKYINNQVMKNTEDIKLLQTSFSKFEEKRKTNEIYFNGQIYDAYFKIYEIFNETKDKLIIIDSYAGNTILDIIKRLNMEVMIITRKNNLLTNQDIERYNKQYNNLKVVYNNTFHDRYFILDKKEMYHCGTSINKIGYKTFSITLISDDCVKQSLLNKVNQIINNKNNT